MVEIAMGTRGNQTHKILRVALVRHGETDWNKTERIQGHSNIPLNETGLRQAKKAADWLARNGPWNCIYSSRLIRARKTAEIIGSQLMMEPYILESLAERKFGALEGLTAGEREERFPRRLEDETSVPGLELRPDFRKRVISAFETICVKAVGTNIIIVSHGGWINQLLFHLSNGTIGSGITKPKNGGIYLASQDDEGWELREIFPES